MATYVDVIDRPPEAAVLAAAAASTPGEIPETDVSPDDGHLQTPEWYVYREISFRATGGVQFFIDAPGAPMKLAAGETIEDVVGRLRNPTLLSSTLLQLKRVYRRTVSRPLARARHHFMHGRPETPLDLNITEPRYVILRLHKAGKWRFSPTAKAVSHKRHPTDDYRPLYGGLRHVPNTAGPSSPDPLDECEMVYFISNPPADPSAFRHSFNFRVQLEQAPRVIDPGTPQEVTVPRLIDIILDPDIRNPDGTPS